MSYEDRSLTCQDCGQTFTFSADDQEFHAQRGYQDPKRCPSCRQAKRRSRGDGGGYSSSTMYEAVCASCGGTARVPFEPRGDRPVYCSDCFRREPAGSSRRY